MNQSIEYNGQQIALSTLKDIEDKVEYGEALTAEEEELYDIYVILDEAMDKAEYGEELTDEEAEVYAMLSTNTSANPMGNMNADFDEMRTIMDKARS